MGVEFIKGTGRDSDKFMLRFPDGMRERIAESAKANNRSMNAEIVARLQLSFALAAPPAGGNLVELRRAQLQQRDHLAAKLASAQARLFHLDYLLRSAKADGLNADAAAQLQTERDEAASEVDRVRIQLDGVLGQFESFD